MKIDISDLINIINKYTNRYEKPPIVMRPPEVDFSGLSVFKQPEKWHKFPKFQENFKKMSESDLKSYQSLAEKRNTYSDDYFVYEGFILLKERGYKYKRLLMIHKELYKCYVEVLRKYQSQINASLKINGIEYYITEFCPGSYYKKGYCPVKHMMNCDCVGECGAIKTKKTFKSTSFNSLQWNKEKGKYERLFDKVILGEKYLRHSGSFCSTSYKNIITIESVPHNLNSVIEPMKMVLSTHDSKN